MAVDTRNKRASAIGIGKAFVRLFPLPDGALDQADRQMVALSYSGILASGAPTFNPAWISEVQIFGPVTPATPVNE